MRLQVGLCTLSLIFLVLLLEPASGYNIVCYFSSWAIYRNFTAAKFDISNIDPSLCTHINFAFVELFEDGSLFIVDPWESDDDGKYHGFQHLAELKQSQPELKILISLGGWNEGSKNFSAVSADPESRSRLVSQTLELIEKYKFDGIDIDWEYPTLRSAAHFEDKENFVLLLKDFSEAYKPKGLLVTAALAGAVDKINAAYDVDEITKYLDMLNLMTYDYHGAFDNFIGHISPLHASSLDYKHGRNSTYIVATGLEYWLSMNVDPAKINMGVPTYGRTFTLLDQDHTSLYDPVAGPGNKGEYTGLKGSLGYHEICEFFSGSDSTYYWDDEQKVPHRIYNDQWIGYDDERSMAKKIDFAVERGVGGIMVWTLDTDDFTGICGKKYILLNTIKNRLEYHEKQKNGKK
ncbi:probable chitinase 2 [Diabrotica virgifera virgifera]|uniref:GH18 domain-containing protein n=1 Tax=Diabrotica virgifera virgifera TaxID=50390 RepID=A0ABM5K158_DIAVI|nr:probable chitinase 2 [Diabrotica virgifera virgifera]